MTEMHYPQEAASLELQAYRRPQDLRTLARGNVSFSGSPRKHPHQPEKIVLIADPCSANTFYYEFAKADITFVEELPSIVDMEGNTITLMRIWIKKGSIAVRSTPFIVGDTRTG